MADTTITGAYNDKSVYSDMYANSNKKSSGLGLDEFLYLLSAQLSNQDMMNPMSDTEFISQLAQFSSLEAMQQLTQLTTSTYSASLLGKEVTVARILSDGSMMVTSGVVTGVGLFNDDPIIYIGRETYYLSEVMAVGKMPETEPTKEPDENEGGDEGGSVEEPGEVGEGGGDDEGGE